MRSAPGSQANSANGHIYPRVLGQSALRLPLATPKRGGTLMPPGMLTTRRWQPQPFMRAVGTGASGWFKANPKFLDKRLPLARQFVR